MSTTLTLEECEEEECTASWATTGHSHVVMQSSEGSLSSCGRVQGQGHSQDDAGHKHILVGD